MHRINADFDSAAMDRLLWLKDRTEAASYSEVLKNALRLHKLLIEHTESGGQILLRGKSGEQREVLII